MNARKCRWCATWPCPYPDDEAFRRQVELGGKEWLEQKPCWTPIRENIGIIYDESGRLLAEVKF
jgi:hypothetical protein